MKIYTTILFSVIFKSAFCGNITPLVSWKDPCYDYSLLKRSDFRYYYNPEKIECNINLINSILLTREFKHIYDTIAPEEVFIDSLNIAKKSLNKIEVFKYRNTDGCYVVIKFFSKKNGLWNLRNKFYFEKDEVIGCDTKLSDFNNDGLNDMTYVPNVAARGANEIRRLFIYNEGKDELVYIKNSEDYPNLLYNKELNCIDAFLVYGGCSTVFLTIDGNSLREIASVELMDGLTVTVYHKNGKGEIIWRDSSNKAGFIRYKNFKPLKEY